MKQWLRVLFFPTLLGGLAYANQITLNCISAAPANLNYWTTLECYNKGGVVTLVTLALQKSQDPTAPARSEGNQVVDTRSDLAQMMAPVTTISGIDVWLPVIASATKGGKQNQNAAGNETQTNGNSAAGDPAPNSNATVTNTVGQAQTAGGGTTQGSSQQAALAQLFAPNLQADGTPFPSITLSDPPGGSASAVPEPTVWLLTALGLASLLYRAKRRMA